MHTRHFPSFGHYRAQAQFFAIFVCVLLLAASAPAQTPEEHASHHPAKSGAPTTMPAEGAVGAGGAAPAGGMSGMGEMAKMMEGMGKATPKELYPSLMSTPEFSPEKRKEVSAQANERMRTGTALLAAGLDRLNQAVPADDFAAMQDATAQMRQGLAQFESGVAARRAIADGKPPRAVAMQWFKGEMNLLPPQDVEASSSTSGLSVFHLFTMALLIAFAVAMLAMYYFKMRRAAALFGRLDPDSKSSPPGSSPPQDGGGGPSPPPGRKAPPSGGTPQTTAPGAEASLTKATTNALPHSPKSNGAAGPTANLSAPMTSKWRGQLVIDSITPETPNIKTFRLRAPGGGLLPFTFLPGQFLNVALYIGGAKMNRSYSISSSPNGRGYVELSVKREDRGAVSRHIVDLWKVGDLIDANGPVGKFTFTGTEADSVVLISAGVGITPLMSVARYLSEQSWVGDIFFIFTCRNPADFIFEKALAALASRNPKLHVVVTMTKPAPDWKGPRGRMTKELLAQSVPNIASRRIHVCGPLPMMEATKALLGELGVDIAALKTEAFGAVKPPLAGPNDAAKAKTEATGPVVTFFINNKTANIRVDQTILELSEELDIGIENSCRVGTCGICKIKMTSGDVEMAVDEALDADDKAGGIILACQAKPRTAVTVEA